MQRGGAVITNSTDMYIYKRDVPSSLAYTRDTLDTRRTRDSPLNPSSCEEQSPRLAYEGKKYERRDRVVKKRRG